MKIITKRGTYDNIALYEFKEKGIMILRHENLIDNYIILQKDFIEAVKENYEETIDTII